MFVAVLLMLAVLLLASPPHHGQTDTETYYAFPKFWTNTGFCPAGKIEHEEISAALLSDANRLQLRFFAAAGVTHIRIHWLLELLEFMQYTQSGMPIYDFKKLDDFLLYLDDLNLRPVIEFMANPGGVFSSNPNYNGQLWMDFSYQIAKRYLNMLGAKTVLSWRYETWNEPDLLNYNRLNFTTQAYFTYVEAVRQGLKAAGRRPVNNLNFQLRGPAGLFKAEQHHPLCWHILEKCQQHIQTCPFDVITYHRKGNGTDNAQLLSETTKLLAEIYQKFPALQNLPISNDEADPIAGWSTARAFQADVRYALTLASIVLLHWQAKLTRNEFKQLETISHDNAFLSFHPHEFSQRTLLAHFRMNQTTPPHSQFIQKPVYAALALLNKLANYAAALEQISTPEKQNILLLKTRTADSEPLYMSWLLLPASDDELKLPQQLNFVRQIPYELCQTESYAYIVEVLAQNETDPNHIWQMEGSPPYPDIYLRELMRRRQTPRLHGTGFLLKPQIELALGKLSSPWLVLLRVCSSLVSHLKQPQQLSVNFVFHNEVLLTWQAIADTTNCLKSYEVWYRLNDSIEWNWISQDWHLPFSNFQYAPLDGSTTNGFYKVRGIDIFDRHSSFSDVVEYFEV